MRVLIAEDDRSSRNILKAVLTQLDYEAIAVEDGNAAWEILQEPDAPKLVILDWVMPGMEGVEICNRLRKTAKPDDVYTYVILLTSKGSKENIVKGMGAGADDYIIKPYDHNELYVRLRAGQRIVELQTELLDTKKKLLLKSRTDSLTGILNRGAILQLIEREYVRSMRTGGPFGLSMLDIDHFKLVNDTYGHAAGDTVLKTIVQRIGRVIRPYDSLGRYGGEEFLILVANNRDSGDSGICNVSERIRLIISSSPILIDKLEIPITASQGTVVWNNEYSFEEMISAADEALYKAKRAGRNRVVAAQFQNS